MLTVRLKASGGCRLEGGRERMAAKGYRKQQLSSVAPLRLWRLCHR